MVAFRFSEPVESNFGAVRVFDARGHQVESGSVQRPGGQRTVGVALKPGLAKGTYTATYRVISADSHPVSGGFVFSIGTAGAAPAETVGDLLAGSSSGKVTEVAFGIARGADYLAIAIVLGTLLFLLLSWPRGDAAPRLAARAAGRDPRRGDERLGRRAGGAAGRGARGDTRDRRPGRADAGAVGRPVALQRGRAGLGRAADRVGHRPVDRAP